MAKLTTKERKALPAKDFAGPDRSYPVEDKSHARDAKGRASEMANKGELPKPAERKIDAAADRKLGPKAGRNSDRTADRVVARMSKSKPIR